MNDGLQKIHQGSLSAIATKKQKGTKAFLGSSLYITSQDLKYDSNRLVLTRLRW